MHFKNKKISDERTTTDHTDQSITQPPTPMLSSNCQNNRSRLEQTAETYNFLYSVVCAIIFPGKM